MVQLPQETSLKIFKRVLEKQKKSWKVQYLLSDFLALYIKSDKIICIVVT